MQNLRTRAYDPANGRFIGLDPFAGNMQDPQSLHKYAYVHGDPIMLIDPRGLNSVAISVNMGMIGTMIATTVQIGLRVGAAVYASNGLATAMAGVAAAILVSQVVEMYGEAIATGIEEVIDYFALVVANVHAIAAQAARAMARTLRANMIPIFPVFNALWPQIYSYRTGPLGVGIPSVLTYMGPASMPGVSTLRSANRDGAHNSFLAVVE